MQLSKIRLLPVTITVMSALLLVKTSLFVEAVAGESTPPAKAEDAATAPAPDAAPVAPVKEVSPDASAPKTPGQAGQAASPTQAAGAAKANEAPPVSDAERTILLDLRKRRDELDARAQAMDQRQLELEAAGKRLAERVQQLSALQTRLEAMEAERQQHKQENWAGLVKVYENMKPRDAAAIFDALDMQVLLQVLDRMQERKAAPILAAMQPDRARLATQLLAEMRTRAITPSNTEPKG